jgi:large subunit ribosomal protein L17
MRHRVAGRKLGRTTEHRIALMRNLSIALFDKEKITTTLAKAKELRPFAEKLVTLSKKESLHSRRLVARHIHNKGVVSKLFDTLSARYAQRPGGYTRIIKLGPRRGDNAEMAIIELVGSEAEAAAETKGKAKAKAKAKAKGKGRAKTKAKAKTKPKADAASAKTDDAADEPKKTKAKKKTSRKKATKKKAAGKTTKTTTSKATKTAKSKAEDKG